MYKQVQTPEIFKFLVILQYEIINLGNIKFLMILQELTHIKIGVYFPIMHSYFRQLRVANNIIFTSSVQNYNCIMSLISLSTSLVHKCLFTTRLAFFASKMQASSTQKTKDSAGRRLGIKKLGGRQAYPGDIIARQRGFKWHPGKNTYVGKDHTIHAKTEGIVTFRASEWRKRGFYYIDIEEQQIPNRKVKIPMPYNYHPQLFPERALKNHPPVYFVTKNKVGFKEQ